MFFSRTDGPAFLCPDVEPLLLKTVVGCDTLTPVKNRTGNTRPEVYHNCETRHRHFVGHCLCRTDSCGFIAVGQERRTFRCHRRGIRTFDRKNQGSRSGCSLGENHCGFGRPVHDPHLNRRFLRLRRRDPFDRNGNRLGGGAGPGPRRSCFGYCSWSHLRSWNGYGEEKEMTWSTEVFFRAVEWGRLLDPSPGCVGRFASPGWFGDEESCIWLLLRVI
jgi:hypothetical protein